MLALQAGPFDAPLANEKVAPSNCCLQVQGEADCCRARAEADGRASPDVHKQFENQCENVRVHVTVLQMVPDSGGAEGCGLGSCPCIRASENTGDFFV